MLVTLPFCTSENYILPLTPWVTAAWGGVYVLGVEVALIVLGALAFRTRWSALPFVILTALVVSGGALLALEVTNQISQLNEQLCFYPRVSPMLPHYSPEFSARISRTVADAKTWANVALGIVALVIAIATFLTVRVFILGWRGRRRVSATPAS